MSILKKIQDIVGAEFVKTESTELQEYGRDWTKAFPADPLAIVFPKTTEEVSKILKLCHQHQQAVVPSGGRTGLAGGAIAKNKEIVLSLKRMNQMGEVDPTARTLKVQAGAVTESVHDHCKVFNLTWPVDFSSKGSSTIGGNIATNAGGVNVIRYGLTRQWVLGLEVVLASGAVLELNGALEKNNTGVDLRQVFIGSEGTLGIITGATLKLAPIPKERDVILFAAQNLETVIKVFKKCRESAITLNAFEFFTDRCLARVQKHLGLSPPFSSRPSHYILMDIEHPEHPISIDTWLEELLTMDGITDGTMAQSPEEAKKLWKLREGISESLSSTGILHKNDIALPIAALSIFCQELELFFSNSYPGWEICLFGHIGDGNLHINIMKPDSLTIEEFKKKTHPVDIDLFTLVKKHQGSISAEHGIGLLKKEFLKFSRSEKEIELFKMMKAVYDPHLILNPGKIFD